MNQNEEKHITIDIPDGYEIDKEKSTYTDIYFKKIDNWRKSNAVIKGFALNVFGGIYCIESHSINSGKGIFIDEKHARSASAAAQIGQIIANDPRFGGFVTKNEFYNGSCPIYYIVFSHNFIVVPYFNIIPNSILGFHTSEQAELFIKENEDLLRQYFMID